MQFLRRASSIALLLGMSLVLMIGTYVQFSESMKGTASIVSDRVKTYASSTWSSDTSRMPLPLSLKSTSKSTQDYFRQVWLAGDGPASDFDLTSLRQQCARTEWHDDVFLHCEGFGAGLTTIMSELRVCLKMAIEAGINLIMPAIALRDSVDLTNFNIFNESAILPYSQWFDEEHFITRLNDACPQMLISRIDEEKQPLIKMGPKMGYDLNQAEGYSMFSDWAWPGRSFGNLFWSEKGIGLSMKSYYAGLEHLGLPEESGPRQVNIYTPFLFFRITQDVTGHDQRVWNDFNHLIRFKPEPRQIVHRLLTAIGEAPFLGIHYRGEKDNIWSSPKIQLERNLKLAEEAWNLRHDGGSMQGTSAAKSEVKRKIYLACGDEVAIQDFKQEAESQGWEVMDKYTLARAADALSDDPTQISLIDQINALPFDHQGSIDLAVTTASNFFIGFTGSAFSWTVANARDPLGRYRGSTMDRTWDPDALIAGNHLFNDGESPSYPCCF